MEEIGTSYRPLRTVEDRKVLDVAHAEPSLAELVLFFLALLVGNACEKKNHVRELVHGFHFPLTLFIWPHSPAETIYLSLHRLHHDILAWAVSVTVKLLPDFIKCHETSFLAKVKRLVSWCGISNGLWKLYTWSEFKTFLAVSWHAPYRYDPSNTRHADSKFLAVLVGDFTKLSTDNIQSPFLSFWCPWRGHWWAS